MVNLPVFPPIAKPQPAAPPPVTNAPPPTAPVEPLVIIGTNVETNWQAYHFAMTNVPEKNSPAKQTNAASPAEKTATPEKASENFASRVETNSTTALAETKPASSGSQTNAISSTQNQEFDHSGTLALAAGFLIGAVALAAIFFIRSRREHGSLISRSMKK
jgi:hypothetical protein